MLFGANGAGKTTLIRVLGTALRPTAGTVRLFGEAPGDPVRPRVGMLSHADGHYDDLTAEENLALAAGLGAPTRTVTDVLERVVGAPAHVEGQIEHGEAGLADEA